MKRCGCDSPTRRMCAPCAATGGEGFTACSLRCLERHRKNVHSLMAGRTSYDEALAQQGDINSTRSTNWDIYAPHRTRMMRQAQALQRGEGICVLGAGNCDDLDLPLLVREFGAVHLVDIDTAALERGLARVPEAARKRITTHAPIDLSGLIHHIDDWGEHFPPAADELGELPRQAARAIAASVGRTFDVVLSSCVLSQLFLPFKRTLYLAPEPWAQMYMAIVVAHLATMAALTREGGHGMLVTDVCVLEGQALGPDGKASDEALDAMMEKLIRNDDLHPDADPRPLMALLRRNPALAPLVEPPRLTKPWLWDIGTQTLVVYALLFRRSAA